MQRIRHLIDPRLVKQAGLHQSLTDSLRHLLPPALAEHCWVAGIDEEQLRIAADAGAWATQVRFLQREILKHLAAHHGLKLRRVRVSVAALHGSAAASRGTALPRPKLSGRAGSTLRQAARGIEDRELAEALERLAARAAKPDTHRS
ncbi:DUF721 domain-containing protein [Thioalkalivibrio sulfidiphilus]|uniref:DUF721 domain-containing protein n=1 Tax=Thioalkalivibrio sulfidiphilus TaxID=1033854 RepID=UPI003BAEBDD6